MFKPMLAPNDKVDIDTIDFPIFASTKLDGIRCIFKDGEMISRSLKQIKSKALQERFEHIKKLSKDTGLIFDGELYSHGLTFQEIAHFVMKETLVDEEVPEDMCFWCFDAVNRNELDEHFDERVDVYTDYLKDEKYCVVVEQEVVETKEKIDKLFETNIAKGFEGLIVKDMKGRYKCGRGTIKEGLIYKMKPFETFDLQVTGVFERMYNNTESYTNELGRSQKPQCKENLEPTGIAGGFVVDWEGQVMKVALTGKEDFRRDIWTNKNDMIGRTIEIKGMLVGAKDVLRHPTFLRFREDK